MNGVMNPARPRATGATPHLAWFPRKGRQVFFSAEKKQKTFANSGVCAAWEARDSIEQSLLVLFFRKERLPSADRRKAPSWRIGIASLALLLAATAAQAADDAATRVCRTNPAFTSSVMQSVLQAQLEKDHDPALDAESPDQLAAEATEQGVSDCAVELRRDPGILTVMTGLTGYELQVAWDAFNISCTDHKASKAECIRAEVGSVRALKRMVATDKPTGAKALVEACELVLQSDPTMAEWRSCVDQTLAMHASADTAAKCKLSVSWHTARTGAEAASAIGKCLKGG